MYAAVVLAQVPMPMPVVEKAAAQPTVETEIASLTGSLVTYVQTRTGMPEWASITIVRGLLVILTLVAAWVVLRLAQTLILGAGRKVLEARLGDDSRRRAETLSFLFFSMAKYVIYFMAFITALYQSGLNPAPFLGGAAVVGLAVAFGSQDLVKDVVTGIFILVENQFAIGEYIDLGGKAGVVSEMSVRMVTIRDDQGRLHNLRYGTIKVVSNLSRSGAGLVADVFLTAGSDEKKAVEKCREAVGALARELDPIISEQEVEGVVNSGTSFALIRIKLKCRPNRVDLVQSELKERITFIFKADEIEIREGRIRFFTSPYHLT